MVVIKIGNILQLSKVIKLKLGGNVSNYDAECIILIMIPSKRDCNLEYSSI